MSPLRPGKGAGATVSVEALERATSALDAALSTGAGALPTRGVDAGEAIITKVRQRTALVGSHTVVALAGATGGGKSSLFNALAGTSIANVGARRPTTSVPSAAIWGPEPAGELLDWLGVGVRHHIHRPSDGLDGLVLLDLPDFDSRVLAHRQEAERILALVDLFVWVTDPQKYADARLHDDYVAALTAHEAVTMVVLNQADRLSDTQRDECVRDLNRLLGQDGLSTRNVLATSATSGEGIDKLRERLANTVTGRAAARTRLAADVRATAGGLRQHVAKTEPELRAREEDALMAALSRTAGVPTVVDAVGHDYELEALSYTGWPFTRWIHAMRVKPLRRLRLGDKDLSFSERELRHVVGRSSIPPPSPAAQAAVALATRQVGASASFGLPQPWAEEVQQAASPPGVSLADALDQAVVGTPLRTRNPIWWRVVGVLQMLFALAAVAGVIWYASIWVSEWLRFPQSDPPLLWQRVPAPLVFLVGGIVLGLALSAIAKIAASAGARRRAAVIQGRLYDSIAQVADAEILGPVNGVLVRHRQTRESLETASQL